MGLDNAVVFKNIKKENIPTWVKLPLDWNDKYDEQEVVYFRKHWGIRGEILNKLHGNDCATTSVDAEDIIPIVKILMKYLDREYYDDNAHSIWEYDEAHDHIHESIINLIWLKMYMESHPEVECYFYDSY